MSGDNYYGRVVNMHGGTCNIGMVNGGSAQTGSSSADPALRAAIVELTALLRQLQTQVPPASARCIQDSLPAITADPAVPPEERHRALMAVAGIAATVGAVGRPVADAVRSLIELIGA
ncbi:hypothetical protein PZB75_18235 [Streptomyces sp. AM 4-1-1]|uniref:hypothetical protein n=1 Tax=Streptomyces sp. AM 4-1-1 TaxID=3028710 RepID=UPI0023B9ED0E|nr:hypothetical protein [Streptomyces sp. AM 4-1-1]WEH35128.1 hypothetical protein PZB75_18235 [Streptomyces sp. AM 4-1-1]